MNGLIYLKKIEDEEVYFFFFLPLLDFFFAASTGVKRIRCKSRKNKR